jgi:hypothetical protein
MRLLVYGNRKSDDVMYDISTPEKKAAAFLKVFKLLDKDWQVYGDLDYLKEMETCEACAKDIHRLCETNCKCMQQECLKKNSSFVRLYNTRKRQRELLLKARAGDAVAAEKLMSERRTYEYEAFSYKEVNDPLA